MRTTLTAEQIAAGERPLWVRHMKNYFFDTLVDQIDPGGADDEITDEIEAAAKAVVCKHYGHFIENDHCGLPAHRRCEVCDKRFPDAEIGPKEPGWPNPGSPVSEVPS